MLKNKSFDFVVNLKKFLILAGALILVGIIVTVAFGPVLDISFRGGTKTIKYYLSAKDQDGQWDLYVLDTERGVWHRQDESHVLSFAELNGELYALMSNGLLYAMNGSEGEKEPEEVTWYAEMAAMGYEYPDHKYLSRFLLRMKLGVKAECRVYLQYDSDGLWRHKGTIRGSDKVKMYLLPVIPRRCEHVKVRFEGHGDMQLYGMARELAIGRE